MVPGREGVERAARFRVHRARHQAPGGQGEGRGAVQGDAAGQPQGHEDRPEHRLAGSEVEAQERDDQALHPAQHHHVRLPAGGRDSVHPAALQPGDEVSAARARVQVRQFGDRRSSQAAAADADRETRQPEEVQRY